MRGIYVISGIYGITLWLLSVRALSSALAVIPSFMCACIMYVALRGLYKNGIYASVQTVFWFAVANLLLSVLYSFALVEYLPIDIGFVTGLFISTVVSLCLLSAVRSCKTKK